MSETVKPDYYKVKCKVTPERSATQDTATIECFDVIDALELDFYQASVLTYLWRMGRKSTDQSDIISDAKKALTYMKRVVEMAESKGLPF